ncbi:hypothetical protein SUGI_0391370 [Cryptomeria japonica]|nr:hypothetical protein SUGI_0391370 [Cryptomeria japonica]
MKWSTGLFGCFQDCSICCETTFLPCVTFGRVAEHAENNNTSCCTQGCLYVLFCMLGVPCLYTCGYRRKFRQKYDLPEEPCGDFCVHLCFECCALSQEAREVKIQMSHTPNGVMAAPDVVAGMDK